MRVVIDTNVLMPGIFFGGVPGRILGARAEGRLELVLSPGILAEHRRVGAALATGYPERAEAQYPVLALVALNAILGNAAPLPAPVSTDPGDDTFLAAAKQADAPVIVSGDQDLIATSGWQNIACVLRRGAPE